MRRDRFGRAEVASGWYGCCTSWLYFPVTDEGGSGRSDRCEGRICNACLSPTRRIRHKSLNRPNGSVSLFRNHDLVCEGVVVGTELRITLPGPDGSADARRSFAVLEQVLELLGELEDRALNRSSGRADDRTTWGISELRLGSVVTTLTPNMPKRGATTTVLSNVMTDTVRGFAATEDREGLPDGWDTRAARTAAELARMLGLMTSAGMKVELLLDKQVKQTVMVTRRSAENLNATLKVRRESIGSVIGTLDTVTLHGKREAALWDERSLRRIVVYFAPQEIDQVRHALGRRVEISGRLVRDFEDRTLSVRMRNIEILPEAADAPATGLIGMSSDMIGDQTPEEHLEELRGAS